MDSLWIVLDKASYTQVTGLIRSIAAIREKSIDIKISIAAMSIPEEYT